jgi:hypothetical protein
MSDHIPAWQCIGCGRIEAPQNCIGVCQDRRVAFVYADEHEDALRDLERERRRAEALLVLVRQLAWSKPRADQWEGSYRALQAQARKVLASQESSTIVTPSRRIAPLEP